MGKASIEIDKNPSPGWFDYEDKLVGQALKSKLGFTQKALAESVTAIASFVKNLKLMIESSEASAKFIKDLKKTESKKFLKEQEAIDSKTVKVVDLGKKVSITETEIDGLNRELKNMKKRKQAISTTKNMDKKTITEKIAALTKEKEKQSEEYTKSRSDLSQQLKIFNEVKDLILRAFNAQSSSIDARMKDNVGFFRKKFTEMISKLSFLKSDPQESPPQLLPSDLSNSDQQPQTPKDPGSPLSTAATSLDQSLSVSAETPNTLPPPTATLLTPPTPGLPAPPNLPPVSQTQSPYQPPARSVACPSPSSPAASPRRPTASSTSTPACFSTKSTVSLSNLTHDNRCELKAEISKYSKTLSKQRLALVHNVFQKVLWRTASVLQLVTEVTDDASRSVSNRLLYLLLLAKEDYGLLDSPTAVSDVLSRLLRACACRFRPSPSIQSS